MPMFHDAKAKAEGKLAAVLAGLASTPEQNWPADLPENFRQAARELRDGTKAAPVEPPRIWPPLPRKPRKL